MDRLQKIPVVIVGAGPTGLTAANLLGMAGIETLLIERNAGLSDYARAIAIDDEGLRICQAMGLYEELLPNMLLDINARYVSRGRLLASVAPTSKRYGYPLISTFYQPEFEATLLKGLERFPSVTVLFGHTVELVGQYHHGVRLSVRQPDDTREIIHCTYMLACDGAKSTVRQQIGIPLRSLTLFSGTVANRNTHERRLIKNSQRWLVVDTINDNDDTRTAIFFCNPARPAVTLPAPHNRRRWEFMLLPGEKGDTLLSTDAIQTLIKQARAYQQQHDKAHESPTNATEVQIARSSIYTFHQRIAPEFSRGHVFLLGDAAHLMPPFAGQGMNSGLRDAYNLCWKLSMVLQALVVPTLLATYHEERYPHAADMIRFSAFLGKAIMPTGRFMARCRDVLFRWLNNIAYVRWSFQEMSIKPQPVYKKGFLFPFNTKESKDLTGTMLPQPHVMTKADQYVLLDTILENNFAILRFHDDPATAFSTLTNEIWQHLSVRRICIVPKGTDAKALRGPCIIVSDCDEEISKLLDNNRDLFVLVRPDRYIMSAFRVDQVDRFTSELQNLVRPSAALAAITDGF